MIKALNIATSGLLQAEKRATDVARDILKTTARAASFSADSTEANAFSGDSTSALTGRTAVVPTGSDFGGLVQQFADLRAEVTAFKANAAVFKAIDETFDRTLGTLIDDEG